MSKKVTIGIVCAVITVVIAIVIIGILVNSYKKLSSDEVGIMYDTFQKVLGTETLKEGLHRGPPGFEYIIFPSVFKSITFDDLQCLNRDAVEIVLDVTYQYKVRASNLTDVIRDFRNYTGYLKVLKLAGRSALHESCSKFNTAQFQAERGAFQEHVEKTLKARYNGLNTDINGLQVSNIARPEEYEKAIRSKERAREDIAVAKNERPRLVTEADTELREAETQAEIIKDKALSDARILYNRANLEAEAIVTQYQMEAEAYQNVLSESGLNFTVDGFLAFLGIRVISDASNPVYVSLQSPARSSYTKQGTT